MQDWADWSIGLGRWRGVSIRIHLLCFLVVAVLIGLMPSEEGDNLAWIAILALSVLLVSSILHEMGHVLAVHQLGGIVDQVVIGPGGGITRCLLPPPPELIWIAALAGPVMNLILAAGTTTGLAIFTDANALGLMHLLSPTALIEGPPGLVLLKLAAWLNWLLAVVNLLPAFPFDGGTALRAILRPLVGTRTAVAYVFRIALTVSAGLVITAWFVQDTYAQAAIPAWLPLLMLALFLAFSARRDAAIALRRMPSDLAGEMDFDEELDNLFMEEIEDEEDAVLIESWQPGQHDGNPQEQDDREEARLDAVLARLHNTSLEQLSPEDRLLLEQASERYRNRQPTEPREE